MSQRTLIIAILSAAVAFAAGYALLESMQPSQVSSTGLVTALDNAPLSLVTGADGTLTISPEAYAGIYGDAYVDGYAYYEDEDDDDHDHDDDHDDKDKHDKDHDEKHDKDHDKKESKDRKSKHDDDDDDHHDDDHQTEVGSLDQGLITTIANFRSAE